MNQKYNVNICLQDICCTALEKDLFDPKDSQPTGWES